jgi:uncharacterized membrane protein
MSVITNIFILTSSKIKSKLLVFRQSILFYPLVFTLIALILFTITSYIDGTVFSDSLSIDIPVLESLIFTGSADAARSILSTIAAGWATILGVAFSITLITLQLSTSRYTSHLINRFEQDKINQITLGWFIFVVGYSLLVLKTVRTEDLQIDNLVPLLLNNVSTSNMSGLANFASSTSFAPVIGVNIAVIIAIVGLYIFVLFLKNISSYLRPNILISNIITSIVKSLKSYSDRNTTEETINKANAFKLMDLRSNSTGIITRIDWDKINKTIHKELFIEVSKKDNKHSKFNPKDENMIENEYHYWLEWSKPLGDRVNKNDMLGILYKYKKNERSESFPDDKGENRCENNFGQNVEHNHRDNHKYNKENNSQKQNDKTYSTIVSAVQVTKDRNLRSDPLYGIDLIQSIAVKASNSRDIDVVRSCISGLFDILRFILEKGDPMGRPFVLCKLHRNKKGPKLSKDRQKNIKSLESKTDDIKKENDGKNKVLNLDSEKGLSNLDTQRTSADPFSLIIDPKEKSLIDLILSELSVINSTSKTNDKIHIFDGLIGEYTRLGMYLVRSDKIDEFIMFTEWVSYQIENAANVFNRDLVDTFVIDVLVEFKKQLFDSGNSSMYNSFVIIIDPLLEKFTLTYDNKT